jgi:hypothetical protein
MLFVQEQNLLLSQYNEKLLVQDKAIAHLYSLLGNLALSYISSSVSHTGITNIVNHIPIKDTRYYYDEYEIKTVKSINTNVASSEIIQSYIRALILAVQSKHKYTKLIALTTVYTNIPEKIYASIIEDYNKVVQKTILKGEPITFGFGTGVFYVQVKLRIKEYKDTSTRQVVDWYESLKVLKEIAKRQEDANLHTLYTQYTTKTINKYEFIDNMKQHTYSTEHPDKEQWLIFRVDDKAAWIVWNKHLANITHAGIYSFTPTNYINTEHRSQIEFANTAKSIDEILDSNEIGFRDKLNILLRYDNSYLNTYLQ